MSERGAGRKRGAPAAAPASAPARGSRSRSGSLAPSAAAIANIAAELEAAAPVPKKAKKASKPPGPTARSIYEQYHIDALFTWGRDFENWTVPEGSDRETILRALGESTPPKNKQEMKDVWLAWYGKGGRKFPELGDTEIMPPYSESDEEAEMDEAEPYEAPQTPTVAPRPLHSVRAVVPAAAATEPASKRAGPARQVRQCLSCEGLSSRPVDAVFVCEHCNRQGNLDAITADRLFVNVHGHGEAADSVGQSTIAQVSGTTDMADKLFEQLARKGEAHPLYQNTESIDSGTAARMLRKAYGGTRYKQPSDALILYVRSGRLMKPQYMVPRKADDEDQVLGIGSTQAGKQLKAPPCVNMHELTSAVLAIMAALIDRPKASVAWMCLLQTASRLTQEKGWATAWAYVERVLNDMIPNRLDFGPWNYEVGAQVFTDVPPDHRKGAVTPGGAASHASSRPGGDASVAGNGRFDKPCMSFNAPAGCNRSACRYKHVCNANGCKEPSGHSRQQCPGRRPGASASSVKSRESVASGKKPRGGSKADRGSKKGDGGAAGGGSDSE